MHRAHECHIREDQCVKHRVWLNKGSHLSYILRGFCHLSLSIRLMFVHHLPTECGVRHRLVIGAALWYGLNHRPMRVRLHWARPFDMGLHKLCFECGVHRTGFEHQKRSEGENRNSSQKCMFKMHKQASYHMLGKRIQGC